MELSHFLMIKLFTPAFIAFCIAMFAAKPMLSWMISLRLWKQVDRTTDNDEAISAAFLAIHDKESEIKTPRAGGLLIWYSVFVTTGIIWILAKLLPQSTLFANIEFVSRSQTWLILAICAVGSCVGMINELAQARYITKISKDGFSRKVFLLVVTLLASMCAWWMVSKLGINHIIVPFGFEILLGKVCMWLFVVFTFVSMFTSGVIDGIDGLSGGVFAILYGAFGVMAIISRSFDIATLCFVISFATIGFLWFNLPPAKWYIGEVGMLGLTMGLTTIAFLLDRPLWLLIIGMPLVLTAFSSLIQIISKRFFNKKVFLIAPLHHHFQALGMKNETIVMKYWFVTLLCSIVGIIIHAATL
jgi:phospho-N-acetylmuramoyl-pentapeptide-transferase